ncbi:MAG: sensor histidine kinase [Caldilineaceae bacterium]|jgi:two-component system sensor histidine kinase YesM|nr:sensor histidine kinase [Caldilineaceae bacterium]
MWNRRDSHQAARETVGALSADRGPLFAPIMPSTQFLSYLKLSLKSKMLLAFSVLIVILGIPYIFLAIPILQYQAQYSRIIDNITAANSINGYIKFAIDAEMWDIVAGKEDFYTADQYAILDDVDAKLAAMRETSSSQRGRLKLRVIQNTMETLRHDIDRVGVQLSAGVPFDDNMVLMERIRWVSELVEEGVQDYMLFEVNRTEQQYRALQAGLQQWIYASVIGMLAAVAFSIVAAWRISRSIYLPIKKLHDVTTTIAREDLEPLVTSDNVDEITELGMSFNILVGKVRQLVAAKVQEQENLQKAELRVLQAQINPHFLYNTLDTIIWMAESKRTAQVVELVRALSRFFRISLSKGKDWITVGEEFEHVSSYLAIQKIRYRDILDYQIDIDDAMLSATILKLMLQPLVENALYHGIKNKRTGGTIVVRGRCDGDALLHVAVTDNGMGMTPERLAEVRNSLTRDVLVTREGGYGLINVNQRIRLYYGQRYGLTLDSEYGAGTSVSLSIPLRRRPEPAADKS